MTSYMMQQERELQKRISRFWADLDREMQIVCPVDKPENFTLHYDRLDRIVTRKPKPQPTAPE